MSTKFPHASRANGRALFTGPIGNWLANGVGPVLISQTGIWSASIIFLHRFRWWLVAGAYCMAVPSYYLKQSWFIVDWNLGIQRSENLSEIEVSLSIMHCKYARIIRLNALKISTVECRYNVSVRTNHSSGRPRRVKTAQGRVKQTHQSSDRTSANFVWKKHHQPTFHETTATNSHSIRTLNSIPEAAILSLLVHMLSCAWWERSVQFCLVPLQWMPSVWYWVE